MLFHVKHEIFPFSPLLRSHHFFERLRLRKSEVPEPTPASTKLGPLRLWLQAATAPFTKICSLELKQFIINASLLLDHIYLYKLLAKKMTPALDSGSILKVAAPGSYGSATLHFTLKIDCSIYNPESDQTALNYLYEI